LSRSNAGQRRQLIWMKRHFTNLFFYLFKKILQQGGSFFVPMLNDPLSVCWDTQIEKGHRHAVAAMIVVIFSGRINIWVNCKMRNCNKIFNK
jgi:hypothetical protein